jgi:hypothetical protein
VTPSPEYLALKGLTKPDRSRPGDMWLCRRLGIVLVTNGHKRGSRHRQVYNNFHLYHWGKPSLWSRPCDWRDNDPNAAGSDPAIGRPGNAGEQWEYIGNIFDLLPFADLSSSLRPTGCARAINSKEKS